MTSESEALVARLRAAKCYHSGADDTGRWLHLPPHVLAQAADHITAQDATIARMKAENKFLLSEMEVFKTSAATVAQIADERHAAHKEVERLTAALAEAMRVPEELEAYRDASQYDAMMEGPRFKGWNRSQLDRARRMTEAAAPQPPAQTQETRDDR